MFPRFRQVGDSQENLLCQRVSVVSLCALNLVMAQDLFILAKRVGISKLNPFGGGNNG